MAIDHPDILAQNILEDCTITYDSTEDSVYKAAYVANRSRVSKFVGEDTTPQHIMFDYGSAVAVDTFVLDKNWTITGGSAQVLLQYSDNASSYTTAATCSTANLADNTIPIWKTFTSESHRYWRLRMTGLTAAPTIYNAWAGTRIQLDTSPMEQFDPWSESSSDIALTTPSGATSIIHRYRKRQLRAQFENMTDTIFADLESWWDQAGKYGKPWWWMWKPASYAIGTATYMPLLFISPNFGRDFPFAVTVRNGILEGIEV